MNSVDDARTTRRSRGRSWSIRRVSEVRPGDVVRYGPDEPPRIVKRTVPIGAGRILVQHWQPGAPAAPIECRADDVIQVL